MSTSQCYTMSRYIYIGGGGNSGSMKLKRVLMEVTAIVIVILFFGTGMQPATIHNSAQTNNPASNEIHSMIAQKINISKVAMEKNMIITNRFVEIKNVSENIDPYISIHYTYYASGTRSNPNLAIRETTYYYGLILSSAFISDSNNNLKIINLKSYVAPAFSSNPMNIHKDTVNPGNILCWTDEIDPSDNNAFILSFNEMNTNRLLWYMAIPGALSFSTLVAQAAPLLAAALGISADAITSVFGAVFAVMVVTVVVLKTLDAMGGYHGIYFGVGYHWVSLWFTGFWMPIPILNANPVQSGFAAIGTSSI